MLRAAPPAPSSVLLESSLGSAGIVGAPSRHQPLVHRNPDSGSVFLGVRSSRRRGWRLSAKAGYKRIPMDTAGAYQLINEDTGERVIVWGGADGLDSPIPSEEVLSWKPDRPPFPSEDNRRIGAEATSTLAEDGSKPITYIGASVGSFNKLKSQHIRVLINKSSKVSKDNAHDSRESGVVDTSSNEVVHKDSVESFRKKLNSDLLRQRKVNNDVHIGEKIQDTNSLHMIPKKELRDADINLSVSRVASTLRGWTGAGSVENTNVGWLNRPKEISADSGFFSRKSFKDLGCSDDIIESLRSQMFFRPSHIQAMTYGPVLGGKSCIIADQSGSGKTLAYIAPIAQRLRQEERLGLSKSLPRSPRVVILVPTAELASQVLNSCRSIAKFGVPFRSMVATGGFRQKTQLDNLQQALDVLIATPGRFIFLLKEGYMQLSNLKCVVLDEVDVLFSDEEFKKVLQSLISAAPMVSQYLFVTATLPVDIYNKLVQVFPDCEVSMGPGMHRTRSGLEEILVDCSGEDGEVKNPDTAFLNKKTALLKLLEESPVLRTIIFCNKIETCRKVENALKRFDRRELRIKALPFHAALEQETRLSNMKEFLSSQSKDSLILVCTDRASRGIDFMNVEHVMLFDFPRDPSEYVRRVGRTARGAVGRGKAFVFVVGKQVSLATRIMKRNQKGHPVHDIPCAYEWS